MSVCVLYGGLSPDREKVREIAKRISKGIERNGESVTLLDVYRDTDKRLLIYDYIVVVSEPVSLFSAKIPEQVGKFLENGGELSGKRGASVLVGGLRKNKGLLNLMRKTEGQGIILKIGENISRPDDAEAFGLNLNVKRNN